MFLAAEAGERTLWTPGVFREGRRNIGKFPRASTPLFKKSDNPDKTAVFIGFFACFSFFIPGISSGNRVQMT